MHVIIATCAGLAALSAVSVQPASLVPSKAELSALGVAPPIELTAQGVRIRLSAHRLAGSVGLLALGALLSELVTSAGRCGCAHSMDHAEWSDLAIRRGLRRRRRGDWVRPRVSQGDKGRHAQHQSQRRAAD